MMDVSYPPVAATGKFRRDCVERHLIIFGLGYSGTAIARAAVAAGMRTTIVSRRLDATPPPGAEVAHFDSPPIATATHLVVTAAPDAAGDPVLVRHGAAIAAAAGLRWMGYLSTTGVYGDRGGAWVDETTPAEPESERGRRRVAAEQAWCAAGVGRAVDLFRLAGIYGPGRCVFDELRAGRARRVAKPGHAFGRIHRDDIAGAVLAAVRQDPAPGVRVFNLADDEPAESAEVIAEAGRLLGLPPLPLIPFETALESMSQMARSFWADNRKVASRMTQQILGRSWLYPSYREGLRAILAEERQEGAL